MSVGRICVREVDLADADESLQNAAQRMNDRKVGCLVVIDGAKRPVGILTDRDITIRSAARGLNPREVSVEEVMSRCPETVREDTPIEAALTTMRTGPFRRLPVVDNDGALAGVLSVDDVLDLLAEEFKQIGEILDRESPHSLSKP